MLASQKWLGRFVLSVYLSLLVVTSFHSHKAGIISSDCSCFTECSPDKKDHAEKDQHPCPICKFALSLSQASISVFRFDVFPDAPHKISFEPQGIALSIEKDFHFLRGPPANC
ncbi:MAG: hypothetical protein HGB11_09060 [Chlorobiales bacterium]|nr:hypothetical protein [Chlorobiales bacterium]